MSEGRAVAPIDLLPLLSQFVADADCYAKIRGRYKEQGGEESDTNEAQPDLLAMKPEMMTVVLSDLETGKEHRVTFPVDFMRVGAADLPAGLTWSSWGCTMPCDGRCVKASPPDTSGMPPCGPPTAPPPSVGAAGRSSTPGCGSAVCSWATP